ncbi:hypothetical protein V5O48_010287 [Marasmius crinis-equi]|uniref:Restriction of telomere capping protein 4 n=1 Tax=Marasmius crinis-equi TaxID=585013 RepID=A0ABR3F983_9AGAR
MEGHTDRWSRENTNMHSDKSIRVKRQPSRSEDRDSTGFEDLGQSGFHASGSRKGNSSKRSTSGNSKRTKASRTTSDSESSEDALLLSDDRATSVDYDDIPRGGKKERGKVLRAEDPFEKAVSTSKILKGLSFKKNRPADDEESLKENQRSRNAASSSRNSGTRNQKRLSLEEIFPTDSSTSVLKPVSRENPVSRTRPSRSSGQSTEGTRPRSQRSRSNMGLKKSGSIVVLSDEEESEESDQPSKKRIKRATSTRRAKSPSRSPSPDRTKKSKTRSFPAPSPLQTPVKRTCSQSRLPLPSPLASPNAEDADRTPAPLKPKSHLPPLSPLSSHNTLECTDTKGKGKAHAKNTEEKRAPRPFPMNLDDSPGSSPLSESSTARPAKRLSDDAGDDPESRKKRKTDDSDLEPNDFDYGDEYDSFFNTGIDPKTLCPFCDARLPKAPTPYLRDLIKEAIKKSVPDPRPTNQLGRKSKKISSWVHICQRHHFETELLPQAEANGWPKEIDFKKLEPRVSKLKSRLQEIIEDVEWKGQLGDDPERWELEAESPRASCVFWQDTLREVKGKGSNVAANVKSQFSSFDKIQPGYYGELGSVIIHHALFELFPPASIEPDLVAPLNPKEFIGRVLVPEVAVRLIMEDRKLRGASGFDEAVQILRKSAAYGVAMFPSDGGTSGSDGGDESHKNNSKEASSKSGSGATAVDEMLQEKARKRRKEIEVEEEIDQQQEEEKATRPKEKSARQTAADGPPATTAQRGRPRPKPKGVAKSSTRFDRPTDSGRSEGEYDSVLDDIDDGCDGVSDNDRATWEEMKALEAEMNMGFNYKALPPSSMDESTSKDIRPPSPTGSLFSNSSRTSKRRAAEKANSKIISVSSGTDSDEDEWSIAGDKKRSKGKRKAASRAPSAAPEERLEDDATPRATRPKPKPKAGGQEGTYMARARARRQNAEKHGTDPDGWSRSMRDMDTSPPLSPTNSKWLLSDDSQTLS